MLGRKSEMPSEPGTEDVIHWPGAARSEGKLVVLATFEKLEIRFRTGLGNSGPPSPVEATATALEVQAGNVICVRKPLLPAATTVAIPAARRLSIASFMAPPATTSQLPVAENPKLPPRLMLTATTVNAPSPPWLLASTCSRPATMSEVNAIGRFEASCELEKTCTA